MPSADFKDASEEISDLVTLIAILVRRAGGRVQITAEELASSCEGCNALDATQDDQGTWHLEVTKVVAQ